MLLGKSSLFNLLANRDAAIVSPTAGTTRDVLEIQLDLGGVKFLLQDTAGVRQQTTDEIEMEGIKRAIRAAQKADLIVAMVDATDSLTGMEILDRVLDGNVSDSDESEDDSDEVASLDASQVFLVCNKNDLADAGFEVSKPGIGGVFDVSCVTQDGIDDFLDALTQRVLARISGDDNDDELSSDATGGEGILITRARHRQHVQAASDALERFTVLSKQGSMAVDMAAEELRLAASELGRITGAVDVEDVLDKLFSDFCIGK